MNGLVQPMHRRRGIRPAAPLDPRNGSENQPSPPQAKSNGWKWVAVTWGVYYAAVYTIGRYPQLKQAILWAGGLIVVGVALLAFVFRPAKPPKEGLILAGFVAWTLTGLPLVVDWPLYLRFLKLLGEGLVMVLGVALAIRHSGRANWFYAALLAVALFNVLVGVGSLDLKEMVDPEARSREAGVADGANALGFCCVLGIVGALAIWGEKRSWLIRGFLIGSILVCLYGIVVAASRGAFVAMVLITVLWPVMCFGEGLRRHWTFWAAMATVVVLVSLIGHFVIENTFLGTRLQEARNLEDNSSRGRLRLILLGVQLGVTNPLFGVGLGQFGTASGTGLYTHSEWAELLSNTGIVGFAIYMSIYAVAWTRLTRTLAAVRDPIAQYRARMARMGLLLLILTGMLFRPNFLSIDTMFLLGIIIGTAHWAEQQAGALQAPALRRQPIGAASQNGSPVPNPRPPVGAKRGLLRWERNRNIRPGPVVQLSGRRS